MGKKRQSASQLAGRSTHSGWAVLFSDFPDWLKVSSACCVCVSSFVSMLSWLAERIFCMLCLYKQFCAHVSWLAERIFCILCLCKQFCVHAFLIDWKSSACCVCVSVTHQWFSLSVMFERTWYMKWILFLFHDVCNRRNVLWFIDVLCAMCTLPSNLSIFGAKEHVVFCYNSSKRANDEHFILFWSVIGHCSIVHPVCVYKCLCICINACLCPFHFIMCYISLRFYYMCDWSFSVLLSYVGFIFVWRLYHINLSVCECLIYVWSTCVHICIICVCIIHSYQQDSWILCHQAGKECLCRQTTTTLSSLKWCSPISLRTSASWDPGYVFYRLHIVLLKHDHWISFLKWLSSVFLALGNFSIKILLVLHLSALTILMSFIMPRLFKALFIGGHCAQYKIKNWLWVHILGLMLMMAYLKIIYWHITSLSIGHLWRKKWTNCGLLLHLPHPSICFFSFCIFRLKHDLECQSMRAW